MYCISRRGRHLYLFRHFPILERGADALADEHRQRRERLVINLVVWQSVSYFIGWQVRPFLRIFWRNIFSAHIASWQWSKLFHWLESARSHRFISRMFFFPFEIRTRRVDAAMVKCRVRPASKRRREIDSIFTTPTGRQLCDLTAPIKWNRPINETVIRLTCIMTRYLELFGHWRAAR